MITAAKRTLFSEASVGFKYREGGGAVIVWLLFVQKMTGKLLL